MPKIQYYQSLEDNLIETKNQNYELKNNYQWLPNAFSKILSYLIYIPVLIFTLIYSKLILRVKIKNKHLLKKQKGYYIYSNHTQILGDVLNPFIINFPKKPYILCSPANLGIPILGKILPLAGALPIPSKIHDLPKLKTAINYYIKKGNPIVIYPEAHLWPWYTKIRKFPKSSFHFPILDNALVFVATTTYSKSKIFKKPNITIYIDGPFKKNPNLTKKENINLMHDLVYNTMLKRSKLSNCEYITYKKKD